MRSQEGKYETTYPTRGKSHKETDTGFQQIVHKTKPPVAWMGKAKTYVNNTMKLMYIILDSIILGLHTGMDLQISGSSSWQVVTIYIEEKDRRWCNKISSSTWKKPARIEIPSCVDERGVPMSCMSHLYIAAQQVIVNTAHTRVTKWN